MRSRKKKLVYFKKIPVRVDLEQWQRLDKIRADYHFKSTYEIMQYISLISSGSTSSSSSPGIGSATRRKQPKMYCIISYVLLK